MVYLECCSWTPKADTSGRGAASRVIERPTFGFDNSFAYSFFDGGTFGSSDTVGSNTVSTDTASGDYGDGYVDDSLQADHWQEKRRVSRLRRGGANKRKDARLPKCARTPRSSTWTS